LGKRPRLTQPITAKEAANGLFKAERRRKRSKFVKLLRKCVSFAIHAARFEPARFTFAPRCTMSGRNESPRATALRTGGPATKVL
jgi:hypothetical protein